MLTSLAVLIGSFAILQGDVAAEAQAVKDRALAALGALEFDGQSDGDSTVQYTLHVPGFCSKSFLSTLVGENPGLVFEDRAWAREYLSIGASQEAPPVLRLLQRGTSLTAEGTLSLPGGPGVRVDQVQIGCSMACLTPLPATSDGGPIDLRFEWDLHSPVNPGRLFLSAFGAGVPLAPIKIELSVTQPFVHLPTRGVDFMGGGMATVEVSSGSGAALDLTSVTLPSCVEIRSSRLDVGALAIDFAETALAFSWHECEPVRMFFSSAGDAQPVERVLPVYHGAKLRDGSGRRVVGGRFMPDERFEAWSLRDGTIRWVFPDRTPCMSHVYAGNAAQKIGSGVAPHEEGRFEMALDVGPQSILVVGTALRHGFDNSNGWLEICHQ